MSTIDIDKISNEVKDKYSVDKNTFFTTPKDDWKDRIQVEIGDSKTPTEFLPQQKISRWDNECNVSIRLKDDEVGTATVNTDKDKIVWSKGNIDAHFYDIPDGEGASEFEVVLKEKPKTNKVEFTLVDKDVEYFYQPELTAEEITQGASRPENVVGSYAVYAKTPKTNWTDGKEYKVGKVGHIFRPKIIDSVGTEVWGDLHIENGILSVTIPQDFLDKAVYPVRHAAGLTFGYETLGGSGDEIYNTIRGSIFSGASGTGTSMTAYIVTISGSASRKFAVYVNSNLSLLTNGTTDVNTSDPGATGSWITANFTSSPTFSAVDYLLIAFGNQAPSPNLHYFRYDAGTSNQGLYKTATYPTLPSTISTPSYQDRKYSIYATYTASGTTSSSTSSSTTTTSSSTSSTTTSSSTSSTTTTTSSSTTITTTSSSTTSTTTTTSSSTSSTTTTTSSSTTTTSTSSSTSSSTTTTLDPNTGGLAFGEQNPTLGEIPITWTTWDDGAGGLPTIVGDVDWGKLQLAVGAEGRSKVYDFGNETSRLITLILNLYGTGQGSATAQMRGQATIFLQDDVSPDWENYTTPISKTWRFIQVRETKI